MTTKPKHLSWDNFKATVFVPHQKRVHRISDRPRIDVFADGAANRIGLILEVVPGATIPDELSRLSFIEPRLFPAEGRTFLEIATQTASLHHEFYHLATAAAERVIVDGQEPIDAIGAELRAFAALLAERSLLGTEREIGLLGELLFLSELIDRYGPDMVDTWIGPTAEPHDFRVGRREFEVKTTLSPRRIHTINGAEQLVPSDGCDLYLVSIVLGPPGGSENGFSLSGTVDALMKRFPGGSQRLKFEALLNACDYAMSDSRHYKRAFVLRRPMAAVAVDGTFPAITRPAIQQVLGALAARVDSFRYDVSVEGLEHEKGSPFFEGAMNIVRGV